MLKRAQITKLPSVFQVHSPFLSSRFHAASYSLFCFILFLFFLLVRVGSPEHSCDPDLPSDPVRRQAGPPHYQEIEGKCPPHLSPECVQNM